MIIRRTNWLGQARTDVSHLRAFESSSSNDFDLLAGKMIAGDRPQILRGFEMVMTGAVGATASTLKISVANGLMLHPLATEAGTTFVVASDRTQETLSATNSRVEGNFTAGQTNFVGVDLRRATDASTSDIVQFLDADTDLENPN